MEYVAMMDDIKIISYSQVTAIHSMMGYPGTGFRNEFQ